MSPRDGLIENADRARRDWRQAERGAHQRGFAGAVGAEHADEFAVLDDEAGGHEDVPAAEPNRNVVEAKSAHRTPPSAASSASSCPSIHA
jgi:hypothetical protein